MKNEQQIIYWLELAEYDLETAKEMLKTGILLYVRFMCHQTIEKALKGYYIYITNKIRHLLTDYHISLRKQV